MQILLDRILKDGVVKAGNVLKVDRFLNHQMDIGLFREIGKEFKRRFADTEINKILTIEASGIGIACIVAEYFDVPVVFAKKTKTKNIAGDVYTTKVESFTHGTVYDIIVSKEFLGEGDKVLLRIPEQSFPEPVSSSRKAFRTAERESGKRESVSSRWRLSTAWMMKQERLCSEMNRKALFFDIDGTLFSEIERQVPQSAVLALKKTRQCGNLVFINTGRTVCQTAGIQMEVESDGLLCGCGTYITTGNEVIYDRRIPAKRTARLKEDIVRFGLDGVLEGVEGCYFQRGESRMPMVNRLMELLKEGNAYVPLGWEDNSYDISKFCVAADRESRKMEFFATIEDEFEIIDRGGGFYECVPLGHSKATAVEAVLGRFGIAKEDAWVFGDSMNDLSMFQYSLNSVLMGKHDSGLEPYAVFTTKTVEEDGIAYALEKLGMLGKDD